MPDHRAEDVAHNASWKRLTRERPWFRKLASQPLAEARVISAGGEVYLVRVCKNSPLVGTRDVDTSDPLSAVFGLLKATLAASADTGWRIDVAPDTKVWRSETVLYTQHVGARAIVVDVVLAITNALERGDILWSVDED